MKRNKELPLVRNKTNPVQIQSLPPTKTSKPEAVETESKTIPEPPLPSRSVPPVIAPLVGKSKNEAILPPEIPPLGLNRADATLPPKTPDLTRPNIPEGIPGLVGLDIPKGTSGVNKLNIPEIPNIQPAGQSGVRTTTFAGGSLTQAAPAATTAQISYGTHDGISGMRLSGTYNPSSHEIELRFQR